MPSQTAWAILSLLTTKDINDTSVKRGVEFLTKTFNTKHMKDNYVIKSYLREYKLWCKN